MPGTQKLGLALVLGLTVLLSGCMGSPEPYHPGYQERPGEVTLESAEERVRRLAIPLEILRNDAYYSVGRKEIARMLGEIPNNLWTNYEDDFDHHLGIDERLGINVAEQYLKRPKYYLDAKARAAALAEGRPEKKGGDVDDFDDFDDDDDDDDFDDDLDDDDDDDEDYDDDFDDG